MEKMNNRENFSGSISEAVYTESVDLHYWLAEDALMRSRVNPTERV